jgi:hypothetical protein
MMMMMMMMTTIIIIIIIIILNVPIFRFSKRYISSFWSSRVDFLELGPDVSKYRSVFIFKC